MNFKQGVTMDSDPRSVDIDALPIPRFDKNIWKHHGFDVGKKFTKKAVRGFPYEKIANDSEYFAAYKEFHNWVEDNTKDKTQLTLDQMEALWGRQFKKMKIIAITGGLRVNFRILNN